MWWVVHSAARGCGWWMGGGGARCGWVVGAIQRQQSVSITVDTMLVTGAAQPRSNSQLSSDHLGKHHPLCIESQSMPARGVGRVNRCQWISKLVDVSKVTAQCEVGDGAHARTAVGTKEHYVCSEATAHARTRTQRCWFNGTRANRYGHARAIARVGARILKHTHSRTHAHAHTHHCNDLHFSPFAARRRLPSALPCRPLPSPRSSSPEGASSLASGSQCPQRCAARSPEPTNEVTIDSGGVRQQACGVRQQACSVVLSSHCPTDARPQPCFAM